MSCLQVVSYAMSHGIPLDFSFSTLQYNITSYDVMLRHFRSSYLRLQYIVLVCVVIDGFVIYKMPWCAVLHFAMACCAMLCHVMLLHVQSGMN